MAVYGGQATCRASNSLGANQVCGRICTSSDDYPSVGASPNASQNRWFEVVAGTPVTLYWWSLTNGQQGATNCWVAVYKENDASSAGTTGPGGTPVFSQQVVTNLATGNSAQGTVVFTPSSSGTYRLYIYINATGNAAVGNVYFDSDGYYSRSGTTDLWNATIAEASQGFMRAGTTVSAATVSNVSPGGAAPTTWTYPDKVYPQITLATDADTSDQANTLTVATKQGGTRTGSLTRASAGVWQNAAGIGPLDKTDISSATNTYQGLLAADVSIANSALSSQPWTHFAMTTPDSSTNAVTSQVGGGGGVGLPTIVASPFGVNYSGAMQFPNTASGIYSALVDCGPPTHGTPGVSGAFTLEAKIKPASVSSLMCVAGRFYNSTTTGEAQPTIWVTATGALQGGYRRGDGGYIALTSATGLITAGNTYDVAMTSDGSTQRLFLNGTVVASQAYVGVEATTANTFGNPSTRFIIGNSEVGTQPFYGIIAEVRWSNIARYTANYTPVTVPLASDANTLGLWHLNAINGLPTNCVPVGTTNSACMCNEFVMPGYTLDVGVRFNGWMQLNSNTMPPAGYNGTTKPLTPPTALNNTSSRLTSDLGFVGFYLANARTEALGGITYTRHLQDSQHLVADVAGDSVTTTNSGTGTGFTPSFITWASSLPGGKWVHSATITSPSGLVGCEINNSQNLTLLAKNPNYNLLTGLGPTTTAASGTHPIIGEDLMAGFDLVDFSSLMTIPPDPGSMYVMLGRFNLTLGRAEYLNSDGTWQPVATLQTAETITAATNASPIQLTVTAHGYTTGDAVFISGVGGNTAANGEWILTVVDANNFTLNNSTGNGAYTSGGTSQKLARNTIYRWPCMRGTEIAAPYTLPDPSSYIIVFPGSASSPWAGLTWSNDAVSIVVPSAGYTQNWIYSSVFVEATCNVNGTPYFGSSSTSILGSHNSHGGSPFTLKLGPLVARS